MSHINVKRLDHIQICMPKGKEDEARKFYTGIMGFAEITKPKELLANGGLWYRVADIQLHIGTEDETNNSKRHPAFEVTDLAVCRKYLEETGLKIKDEIQIPGQIRFTFFDPFNNRIELLQKL